MRPKNNVQYEKFIRDHSAHPWGKFVEKDGTEILLTDTLIKPDTNEWHQGRSYDGVPWSETYPNGLWQTSWAVNRGGLDVMSWVEFDAFHDPEWPNALREEGRINSALVAARSWIASCKQVGKYARH